MTATPNQGAAANRSVRHGSCFRRRLAAHHATSTPPSAVAELGIVRRRYALPEMVTYYNTQTQVLVGDHIEFKIWAAFWRGWQPGRVHYVPGISPKNPELERDGMSWVSVHSARGGQAGIWVEPSTQQLRKTVRFVRRTDGDLSSTPTDYYFGDEEPQNANTHNAEPCARLCDKSARPGVAGQF